MPGNIHLSYCWFASTAPPHCSQLLDTVLCYTIVAFAAAGQAKSGWQHNVANWPIFWTFHRYCLGPLLIAGAWHDRHNDIVLCEKSTGKHQLQLFNTTQ